MINKIIGFIGGIFSYMGMVCVMSIPAWLLWWWIANGKLGLPYLSLVEMVGLLTLCKIMFKPENTKAGIYIQKIKMSENGEFPIDENI